MGRSLHTSGQYPGSRNWQEMLPREAPNAERKSARASMRGAFRRDFAPETVRKGHWHREGIL
jgi:hypothetical protein